MRTLLIAASIASLVACSSTPQGTAVVEKQQAAKRIDGDRLVKDLQVLAADDMEGRKPGTPGHEKARAYIVKRFEESGIKPYQGKFVHTATFRGREVHNVIGVIEAREPVTAYDSGSVSHPGSGGANEEPVYPRPGAEVESRTLPSRPAQVTDKVIALTAHYAHIGRQGERIYNGSDDNASGTAALFHLGAYFAKHPPRHTLIIAALDCEEIGMQGATAFIDLVTVPKIALNVNIDMISRDVEGELYAVGTRSYPFLKPYLTKLRQRPPVKLLFGFDGSNPQQDDWTTQSDHAAFHRKGIPFIYFGDENAEHHHVHTDDPSTMIKDFYIGSTELVLDTLLAFDADLPAIVKASGRTLETTAR